MKKFSKSLALLSLITVVIIGCDKKEDPNIGELFGDYKTNYQVKLDGKTIMENKSGFGKICEVTNDINSGFLVMNKFVTNESDISESITFSNIHNLKVGETITLDNKEDYGETVPEVSIIEDFAKQKIHSILKGTLTRDSDKKISFKATQFSTYEKGQELKIVEKNLTGYVISNELKKLGEKSED